MADFVAVLKKTIAGLAESTPEARERVYAKARATIDAKLAAIKPAPPSSVVERQKKALDDAIVLVEAEFAPPPPAEEDDLEALFASMDLESAQAQPVESDGITAVRGNEPTVKPASQPLPMPTFLPEADGHERPLIVDEDAPSRRGRAGMAIAAGIAVLVLAGGGYALWLNNAEFRTMLGTAPSEQVSPEPVAAPDVAATGADEEGTDAGEDEAPLEETAPSGTAEGEAPPAADEPRTDVAAVAPAEEAAPATPEPAASPEVPQKFTQRLTPDGQEVDVGPADGAAGVGEGTSVATAVIDPAPASALAAEPAQTPPTPATQPAPAAAVPEVEPATTTTPPVTAAPQTAQATPPAAEPTQPAIAVGQRAIFYEERTNAAQGSAETGSIVWSIVQESPGGDLPPEPAIRAEATVPGKDLQLRMTIRRNRDQTLPASHIVELIFLTPENFEGGGIENVLRMTMKASEESAGNPLLGIPAKIADGFFLLALTDGEPEIAQNLALMQRDQWIDVPMVYRSGRRALITMEKGVPGTRVFEEAVKAWQTASSG